MKIKLPRKLGAGALAASIALSGALVAHYEGARYTAYQDVTGTWTICNGHTRGVKTGDTATPQQCAAWRYEDLQIANDAINRCITHPLTVNQRAALQDAVYNIGPAIVCGSTLQRKANAGEPFCDELLRWDRANGKVLPGLVKRRQDEAALCKRADSVN